MIVKIIFGIMLALYIFTIYMFAVKMIPSFFKFCKDFIEYIKISETVDYITVFFILGIALTAMCAYIVYIIGVVLWMMSNTI